MKKYKKTDTVMYFGVFILSLLFYLIWYIQDGVILTNDAESYISMQSDREPGYCTFLAVLRFLFGAQGSLHAAVIVQCILAALAAAALVKALSVRFNLNHIAAAAVLIVQYGITLLNKFAAQRHYSYYNSIETEGLSYSLWIFFFLSILEILYERRKKGVIKALVWSVLLISIRKQMLITLIILFFALLYAFFIKEKYHKKDRTNEKGSLAGYKVVIAVFCVVLAGFAASQLIDYLYNFGVHGEFSRHSGDSSFILGTELYLADEEMAESIQDEVRRELFLEIMRRADENEYNIRYAKEGWQNIEEHYSQSYDNIKFQIMTVVIREYLEETGNIQNGWWKPYNEIAGTMMKELLLPCMPGLFKLFWCNFVHGLITTILKVNRILNPIAVLTYILYIALLFVVSGLRKRKGNSGVSSLPFALTVLAAIVINDAFTSVTIYPQMRYVLYNTAFFYQSGIIVLAEFTSLLKNKTQ